MSSYSGAGQNYQYQLPFASESVPSSFMSNKAPRPINCTLQTVNVPTTSANASANGTSVIQVPLGQAAYICNPYIRFKVVFTGTAADTIKFKGAAGGASALIASMQTSINSTLIDNIQSFGVGVMEPILSHSTSRDWLVQDGSILMNTNRTVLTIAGGATTVTDVYCIPLIGLLGSQQAFPAWAINGILQLNINWNSIAGAITQTGTGITAMSFQELAFVYDRVSVEGDFIAKMRGEMAASGAKYCYGFTNYQSLTAQSVNGSSTVNTGLNVSSLRGVVMTSVTTADLTDATANGFSIRNGLTNFSVTLDGRLVNSNILNALDSPAVAFVELQKVFSRCFDSSVTDNSTSANYATESFCAGVSATRVAEGLAFQGSPVSVVGLQLTQGNDVTGTNYAATTNFIVYISDYQLLIGADGQVDLVR
jgi:hypothetical protein